MKKTVLSLTLAAIAGSAVAGEYPQNPVQRPLTLNEGAMQITGAVGYGEERDGDEKAILGGNFAYGITDNLMVDLGTLTYRFLPREALSNGLELAVNVGLRDADDDRVFGDSIAWGADVFGKQVINQDFAVTFGMGYVYWDEERLDNKKELTYSLGAMYNLAPDWTLSAGYTYRDLINFSDDNAYRVHAGLNYALNYNTDVGLVASYSNYDEQVNGRDLHEELQKGVAVYMNYRF